MRTFSCQSQDSRAERPPYKKHLRICSINRQLSCTLSNLALDFTMRSAIFTLAATALFPSALAATYGLTDNYIGSSFLSTFTWEAIADPTAGRVSVLRHGYHGCNSLIVLQELR